MLTNLYATYAMITNAECVPNGKRFCKAYAPTNPIEVIWRQINDTVKYTNTGSMPYSIKQVIDNAYQLVFHTGVLAAACQEWNRHAAVGKMLPHLRVFFAASHWEWRLLLQNKTSSTYGAAHNTNTKPEDGYLQQDTVDAIKKLVKATESDRGAIMQLTVTTMILTTELTTVKKKFIVDIQEKCASCSSGGGRNKADSGQGSGAAEKPEQNPPHWRQQRGALTWSLPSTIVGCAAQYSGTTVPNTPNRRPYTYLWPQRET